MGYLSAHVLDVTAGVPAEGVEIELFAIEAESARKLAVARTNADGRTDAPILDGAAFARGVYELRFHVGAYFKSRGVALPDPPFLDVAPIRFGVAEPERHYHVPLLVSPYAYSTYRGS